MVEGTCSFRRPGRGLDGQEVSRTSKIRMIRNPTRGAKEIQFKLTYFENSLKYNWPVRIGWPRTGPWTLYVQPIMIACIIDACTPRLHDITDSLFAFKAWPGRGIHCLPLLRSIHATCIKGSRGRERGIIMMYHVYELFNTRCYLLRPYTPQGKTREC